MKNIKGIITSDGKPASDVVVMIVEGSQSFLDIASLTDEAGEFSFSLQPGHYKARAFKDDLIKETSFEVSDEKVTENNNAVIHIDF
jgi:hypothetical protein